MAAYDTFAAAAETDALKVVLEAEPICPAPRRRSSLPASQAEEAATLPISWAVTRAAHEISSAWRQARTRALRTVDTRSSLHETGAIGRGGERASLTRCGKAAP